MTKLDENTLRYAVMFEELGEEQVRALHVDSGFSAYRPYAIRWLAFKAEARAKLESDRAERSVIAAERAVRWAMISAVIAVLALVVSVVAFFRS